MKYKIVFSILISLVASQLYSQRWEKIIKGDLSESPMNIWQTPDGGYAYTVHYATPEGDYHSALIKTDERGNTIWSKSLGLKNQYFKSIGLPNGSFVLAMTQYHEQTNSDFKLIGVSAKGKTVWQKTYPMPGHQFLGSIAPTNDNGVIIQGLSDLEHLVVVSIGEDGNIKWQTTIESPAQEGWMTAHHCLSQSKSGQTYFGWTQVKNLDKPKGHLTAIDQAGKVLWTKKLDENLRVESVCCTADDQCLVGGSYDNQGVFLAKYGADGVETWFKKNIDSGNMVGIAEAGDGTIGALLQPDGMNSKFIQLDAFGKRLFKKLIEKAAWNYGWGIGSTSDNGFIFSCTVYYEENNSPADVYLVKIGEDVPYQETQEPVQADTSATLPINLPLPNQLDVLVSAFPNPFMNEINFRFESDEILTNLELTVFDANGKPVHSVKNAQSEIVLAFSHLPPGTYFYVTTENGKKLASGKIIKQQ